ncbi:MAG: hypothetical protein ACO31I_09855 [Prochlorotrichaceae cyanobacterium]|jgi:hypothetical protein
MKSIEFQWQGDTVTANLGTKITKQTLYGYAKRIVEKDGQVLRKGYLSPEGQILERQEIDYAKVDPQGTVLEEVMTEIEGQPAALFPSAFDQANPLIPVPLETLVGFNTTDVYPIVDLNLPPGLYETEFSYRKSYTPREAFLLVKAEDDTAFLLVGERKNTPFVGLQVIYDFFDAEGDEEDEDDLDFAMI